MAEDLDIQRKLDSLNKERDALKNDYNYLLGSLDISFKHRNYLMLDHYRDSLLDAIKYKITLKEGYINVLNKKLERMNE